MGQRNKQNEAMIKSCFPDAPGSIIKRSRAWDLYLSYYRKKERKQNEIVGDDIQVYRM